MQILQNNFAVNFECFSSPLNNYFDHFCSVFEDSDIPFGSFGSFFKLKPVQGSFQACPPLCEITIVAMVNHMFFLLNSTALPLSFIIFIPVWSHLDDVKKLFTSKYTRGVDVISAKDHFYVKQRCADTNENIFLTMTNVAIVYLQTAAAFDIWEQNFKELREKIVKAYKHHNNNIHVTNNNNNYYDNNFPLPFSDRTYFQNINNLNSNF